MRVKVRVELHQGESLEVKVLVNSGAESERPLIALDTGVVGLRFLKEAQLVEVEQAVGSSEAYLMPQAVKLILLGEGEELSEVVADLVLQEGLREPLITDATIDALGIQVLSFKEGLWKHSRDPPGKVRHSAK